MHPRAVWLTCNNICGACPAHLGTCKEHTSEACWWPDISYHSSTLYLPSLKQPAGHESTPAQGETAQASKANTPRPSQLHDVRNAAWYVFVSERENVNCHHPQPTMDPQTALPSSGSFPLPLPPPQLTSSTWAWVCCSLLLLVRFGGGAGGPPSPAGAAGGAVAAVADLRGTDGLTSRPWSPRPRSEGSAHPSVHPSVPPFLLLGRRATRREPWPSPGPAGKRPRDLEGGPLPPPGLSFPACQMRATSQPRSGGPAMKGGSDDRGGAGGPCVCSLRRQRPRGRPGTRGSPAARAPSRAPAWPPGARGARAGPRALPRLGRRGGGRRGQPGRAQAADSHGGGSGRRTWQQQGWRWRRRRLALAPTGAGCPGREDGGRTSPTSGHCGRGRGAAGHSAAAGPRGRGVGAGRGERSPPRGGAREAGPPASPSTARAWGPRLTHTHGPALMAPLGPKHLLRETRPHPTPTQVSARPHGPNAC